MAAGNDGWQLLVMTEAMHRASAAQRRIHKADLDQKPEPLGRAAPLAAFRILPSPTSGEMLSRPKRGPTAVLNTPL
jgi:hypothetical protein